MKYIIDMSEKVYNIIQGWDDKTLSWSEQLLKTATPLPKGHGRLKDIDKVERLLDLEKSDNAIAKALKNIMESVPTVIEADKESKE